MSLRRTAAALLGRFRRAPLSGGDWWCPCGIHRAYAPGESKPSEQVMDYLEHVATHGSRA